MALDLQARSMAAQVQANLDEYIETFQNGMKFVGVSSTDPLVSGATVSDYSDWAVGNIVLYSDKEYLLTATPNIAANWVKFGEDITEVVANPEVYGSEDTLTSLQVGDTKYIVPSGGGGSDSSLKLAIDLWSSGGWSTSKDVTGTVGLFTNLLSTSGYSDEGVYAVLLGPPPEELDKLFRSEDQTEWESYFESLSDDHQCGFGYFNGEIMIDSRFIQSFFAYAWDAFTPMALILKVNDFDENNPAVDWFNNRSYVHIIDLTWADITDALDHGN